MFDSMIVNVDMIGQNGQVQGEVAQQFLSANRLNPGAMRPFWDIDPKTKQLGAYVSVYSGGDPKKPESYRTIMVNGATLRRDEWKMLDDAVIGVAESRLTGVQDLISRGLVYNLGNGMGTTVLETHDVSDALEAELSMDGVTRAKSDRPQFSTKYLPIPIIHVDYEINTRTLEASRKLGTPLDTTFAERAARKVGEKLENMLFTNTSYTFGGGAIYSLVNFPTRNLVRFADVPGAHWNDSPTTGAQIVKQVLAMKQKSIDNFFYGPWVLYIPTGYETAIDADYAATTPGTTIRERILKIAGITDIKVVDTLTADNVLLVQTTSDVVRIVRGMGIQNVEWSTEGRFITKYKVMTIQVPQIRADQNGKTGIVHLS